MHVRLGSLALLLLALVAAAAQQPGAALKEPVGEIPGAVVVGTPTEAVRAEFVDLAGGKKAKLVVVAKEDAALESWKKHEVAALSWAKAGKGDAPALEGATGVWFDGAAAGDAAPLRRILERGGAVGGTTGLGSVDGLGLVPGVLFGDQHTLLAKHPGFFAVRLPEHGAVVFKGRRLKVIGDGAAEIVQAAGGGKPASTRSVKAGDLTDVIAQSRSAVARSQPAFPPAKLAEPLVPKGTLIIGGGGGMGADVWQRFLDAAGGKDGLIVVVPTALEDPQLRDIGEVKSLTRAGAKNVKVLHTRDRAEANKPEFAALLKDAKGVWFSGGRQWRFVDAYAGTLTEQGFHDVLARGGVIGGSSAGASIQSEYMPRGDPLGNLNIIAEGYERGFGFLKGAAVDQHFFVRKRTADMTQLMKTYPQLLGIGIDESTTIIVQGPIMEVVGKTKAAVYDTRKPAKDGKDYEEVPTGAKYDLVKRQRVDAVK